MLVGVFLIIIVFLFFALAVGKVDEVNLGHFRQRLAEEALHLVFTAA